MTPDSVSTSSNPITAEMHAEIEAAMKELEQAKAELPTKPGASPAIRGPRVVNAGREHRHGKVVSIGPSDIFVEFGPKELGIVPRAQFPEDQLPAKDSTLEVVIDKYEPSESIFICSRPGAVQKAAWEFLEPGQVVEGRVTGVATKETKQVGLELEVAGHKAFMPAGQVSLDHIKDLSVFVGEKMKAQVTRVERSGRGNIVLSRREVLLVERAQLAESLKGTLAEGQTIAGTVRKIMDFGAFVDIGGVDGLIHFSDLTYDRVNFGAKNVEKYVKEGQQVTVRILKLDWENKRIGLGLKQTQSDPFATALNAVVEGAEVSGRVTKILDFGAFVEIGPGVEGMVHISELDHRRVASVGDVLKPDEIVRAKVLKIDKDNRRVSLSIKALKPMPEVTLGGSGGGPGGGKGKGKQSAGRSAEEILKETPALRRMREKAKNMQFKGGLS
ncbi:MAG: hypothetical protein HBSAPP03_11560 [Phycisphaerae bacterium]|nr:MAG: hypothetical protein HBSAPP03_11560 [Phycisphaerae bacterium]